MEEPLVIKIPPNTGYTSVPKLTFVGFFLFLLFELLDRSNNFPAMANVKPDCAVFKEGGCVQMLVEINRFADNH